MSSLTTKPLVSICIPLYNKVSYIGKTLDLVLNQTYFNLEVVVCDNASNDGSDKIIKEREINDPRIKYYRLENTISLIENWRYVVRLAKGDFVHILCADDIIELDFIEEMMAPLLANRSLDFSVCYLEPLYLGNTDLSFIDSTNNYIALVNQFNKDLLATASLEEKRAKIVSNSTFSNYFGPVVNVLIKRSCLPVADWTSSHTSLGSKAHPDWDILIRTHSNYQGYFVNKHLAKFSYNQDSATMKQFTDVRHQLSWSIDEFLIGFTTLTDSELTHIRNKMSDSEHTYLRHVAHSFLDRSVDSAIAFDKNKISTRHDLKVISNYSTPHILLCTDDPSTYGVAQHSHAIAKGLIENEYQVSYIQSHADNHLVRERQSLGIQHFWLESPEFSHSLNNKAEIKKLFEHIKPDLVIFSNCCPISNLAAKKVAIELQIPFIIIEGSAGEYLADRFANYLPAVCEHYQQARQVISVSDFSLQSLRGCFSLAANHGKTIYLGKSETYFKPIDLITRNLLRYQLEIPSDAVVCFTSARMDHGKGYQYQLDAIAQLKNTLVWDRLYFVWAGEGSFMAEIKQSILDLGVGDRVKLLGLRLDIDRCLDVADIFILPSQLEGMPHAIMEAMAKGLPVIASSVGGIPEELGATGKLLTDPTLDSQKTVMEIVDTLHSWVSGDNLRKQIGSACKERAIQLFTADRMILETLDVVKYSLLPIHLEEKLKADSSLATLHHDIQEHHNYPANLTTYHRLLSFREEVANTLLNLAHVELQTAYQGLIGKQQRLLVGTNLPITMSELELDIVREIEQGLNHHKSINYLLAGMLYLPAYKLPLVVDINKIPDWLKADYLKYLLKPPVLFTRIGEADLYYQYLKQWIGYLHEQILSHPNDRFWQKVAEVVTHSLNCISLYFNSHNLKHVYKQRAEIIEFHLKSKGCQLDYEFPERNPARSKIRIGILAAHYAPQTETFTTLPFYQHLNRDIFEIVLYTLNDSNHRLRRYCSGHADAMVVLPNDLTNQVQTIRVDDLDLLLIATNVTAVTNAITLLTTHRLARIQCVNNSSCATTGIKNVDYYLSGSLTELEVEAQSQYTEKLLCINGSAHCRDEATEGNSLVTITVDRSSLGLAEDDVVYISGANFFKITPELELSWAKILKQQPKAKLVLYPFNPNWSNHYPINAFKQRIKNTFTEVGLEEDRLIILEPVANFADVKARLELADVYLDSFPFSSINSLIDPLEVGLPIVVHDGNNFRSLMGAALLRSLEITDLVADSEESYIQLAVALGNNPELRQQKSAEVKAKMADNPSFLDSKGYGAKIGELFKELVDRYSRNALSDNLRLKDVNLMMFPDWSQSEESVGLELQQVIQTLATQPDAQKTTLLIDTTNIAIEDAEMFLSSVAMNLMMEEDLDISEELEISLIEDLNNIQWENLSPRINARIVLECDNQAAVGKFSQGTIPQRQIESFILS
jgi:predicted O-linked N-acetylglucosamine transferase (SPINDLY family)/glycosyltransferase involved in cell wall biosynthesis